MPPYALTLVAWRNQALKLSLALSSRIDEMATKIWRSVGNAREVERTDDGGDDRLKQQPLDAPQRVYAGAGSEAQRGERPGEAWPDLRRVARQGG